jgi:DNA-binding NarL/FixJ family response regulator
VFVLDDHPLLRRGYAYILAQTTDLELCGDAGTVEEALEQIQSLKPDLVVADISLDGMNGLEFIKSLHYHMPGLPVLVVSMHDENFYAERALRAGARGYVMKRRMDSMVVTAIRKLLAGGFYLSDTMTSKILLQFQGGSGERVQSRVDGLTDRELTVFELLGKGMTTRQIGEALHISPKTVETHRGRIKTKLVIDSTPE